MMTTNQVIMPILLPWATAILLLFFYKNVRVQKAISTVATIAGLITAVCLLYDVKNNGIISFSAGNWEPSFGIVLVADLFSAIMILISSIVATACLIFSFRIIDHAREKNFYYMFYQMLLVGINGSFLTGDIFNLYVFFEIMLLSSYILLVLGGEKGQLRETFKYLILNVLSSVIFLIGLALLYGMMGTLNMADLASKLPQVENQGLVSLVAVIFLIVFGIKGALFPLFYWLPQSYCEPPSPIAAIFGGLLTKVGVYALIRIFTLLFIGDGNYIHKILLVMGVFTMIFGILGTIFQMDFKKILSYHIISQIGYMIIGLGLFSTTAIAGAIFYIAHNSIVKTGLFLFAGVTEKITGTNDLKRMGGLLHRYPLLGWGFLVTGLSLAGVPPLSGFIGKLIILRSASELGNFAVMGACIAVSFLTLFSMLKVFLYAFWGEEKITPQPDDFDYKRLMSPCIGLMGLSIAMGLGASYTVDLAILAAEQLMDPSLYINAVLAPAD